MPKEYQPKQHSLPHNVYMQVIYLVRDYERMKAEYASITEASPPPLDGVPRGSGISDPTSDKAIRLEELGRRIRAVEAGLGTVPEEYRKGVYNNIVHRIPYDTRYASYETYRYHRRKAVRTIAREMRLE